MVLHDEALSYLVVVYDMSTQFGSYKRIVISISLCCIYLDHVNDMSYSIQLRHECMTID